MQKKKNLCQAWKIAIAAALIAMLGCVPAFAGQWVEQEDGAWKYEEDGSYLTGWVQEDGFWYYMDTETGEWDPTPAINRDSVCYLLENAVKRAGWYATETSDMVYHIESASSNKITVSILLQTQPNVTTSTLARFEVSVRDQVAKELSTKLVLKLYE